MSKYNTLHLPIIIDQSPLTSIVLCESPSYRNSLLFILRQMRKRKKSYVHIKLLKPSYFIAKIRSPLSHYAQFTKTIFLLKNSESHSKCHSQAVNTNSRFFFLNRLTVLISIHYSI